MNFITNLEKISAFAWIVIGLISVIVVCAADFWSGHELSLFLFYLIPILLVTWFAGRKFGILIGLASAIAWFSADSLSGQTYSQPIISYWNAFTRLTFFVLIALILPALQELAREKEMARTDYLTGAANRRFFFELVGKELNRAQHYEYFFAIVYMDVDGFKKINDQLGHKVGDELLRVIVRQTQKYLREMDTIARVGGDEFILLLPQVDHDQLKVIASRIQAGLIGEMKQKKWAVTFSMGALLCSSPQITADELVKKADELMYSIKNNGKNGIAYSAFIDEAGITKH